jgi:Fe2+ or Zn2+ uptake regulation protein
MNTDLKESLIKMVEDNPQLYKIISSKDHMIVLEEIYKKKNIDIEYLQRNINIKKYTILYNILESLIKENLIKKIKLSNKDVYFINENGQKIIDLYKKTKQKFTL